MAQQEIRINIAGRYYAMYITPEQEEVVRRIGKNIEITRITMLPKTNRMLLQ